MRNRDLQKKCATLFSEEEHRLIADTLVYYRFHGDVSEDESLALTDLVNKLRRQVDLIEDARRAEAEKLLQKIGAQIGKISTARTLN
jgi:hypothetical protein